MMLVYVQDAITSKREGKAMKKIILVILFIVLAGCSSLDERALRLKEPINICKNNGGIPIFSVWDTTVMVNCIFNPKGK